MAIDFAFLQQLKTRSNGSSVKNYRTFDFGDRSSTEKWLLSVVTNIGKFRIFWSTISLGHNFRIRLTTVKNEAASLQGSFFHIDDSVDWCGDAFKNP